MPAQEQSNGNSNNSNAPGTFPDVSKQTAERLYQANQYVTQTQGLSYDPKAPVASDPLNSGIPIEEVNTDIEIMDEFGGTGTLIVQGVISQADYNPDLSGRERTKVYDKMRKGDATVRLALAAIKYPIFSTNWYIKPGEGEDDKGEITSFVREELFQNPNFSWTSFMHQAFLFCDYGNSFAEKVFRKRADGKIGWKKFAPRLPHTVWRYTLQDGVTPGITQILPIGGIVEIPQWKLLMFILELEGSNYEGTSILRSMHKHWYYKDVYYKIDAIASERQGMGVPIIKVPPQATPQDKARAKIIAKNLRVNELAYVDLPKDFELTYVDTKAKELKEVKDMIVHHDRQILKGAIAHFLDLGASSSGSMALSNNQFDMFNMSEQYIAKIFQEPMNLAIRELVDLNYSTKKLKPNQYPTLEYGNLGKIDLKVLSEALKNFVDAGIVLPDDSIERHIRQSADLPPVIKEDQSADWKDRTQKNQPPMIQDPAINKGKVPNKKFVNSESEMGKNEFVETFLELKEELEDLMEKQQQ